MANVSQFNKSYEAFIDSCNRYLIRKEYPNDSLITTFYDYYLNLGSFIKNVFSLTKGDVLNSFIEIYRDLEAILTSNRDNQENIIDEFTKNYEFSLLLLEDLFLDKSIRETYNINFSDFAILRERLAMLINARRRAGLDKLFEKDEIFSELSKSQKQNAENLKRELKQEMEKWTKSFYINQSKEFSEISQKGKEEAKYIEDLRKKMEFEIEEIKARYKDDLSNFELIKQELIFTKAADWNKRSSYIWSGILITLIIILVIASCIFINMCWKDTCKVFVNYANQPLEFLRTLFYTDLAKNILIRLFLLSMLVFMIKYAMKHINALMHNYTVNTHKANSLAAAMRIFASIKNESTRDLVMASATKEIFNQQRTGYLTKEDGKLDFNILEKFASIFKNSKI